MISQTEQVYAHVMYTRKYDTSVLFSLQLYAIAVIPSMSVHFSQRKYLYFTVENVSTDWFWNITITSL